MHYEFLGMWNGGLGNSDISPQWEHTNTKWIRLCGMGYKAAMTE